MAWIFPFGMLAVGVNLGIVFMALINSRDPY